MKKADLKKKKLGEVLLEAGIITKGQLEEALLIQRKTKRRLGRVFTELGYVDETELCNTISKQLKIPMVDLDKTPPEEDAKGIINEETAREKGVIPVRIVGGNLTLAMTNPLDWMTIQEVEFAAGMKVNVAIAPESSILRAIDRAAGIEERSDEKSAELPEAVDIDISKIAVEGFGTDINSLYRASEFPPVVQTFSALLSDALMAGATDLHLEPREKYVQIRIRVDGTLRNTLRYPRRAHDALAARAKALSRLDIANRTMPQEGSNRLSLGGREINIRVNTMPSVNGESILVSLAEKSQTVREISELGMHPDLRRKVSALLHRGHGLLILSGLKGSGRTATLYSLLKAIESDTLSIVAIGTSRKYSLPNVKEVVLNEAAGFGMSVAITAALKHDPDVIATGEIKTEKAASAAIEVAMKGKLVISITDAPDVAAALVKLSSLGISSYSLRSAVTGVMAQKLLKGICTNCKEPLEASTLTAIRDMPELKEAYTGTGCKKCGGTGIKNRVAVFELIAMDHNLVKAISSDEFSENNIRYAAQHSGHWSMFEDAWAKVSSGDITIEEALSLRPG
jgi:type IV pilus assembly protein PilB